MMTDQILEGIAAQAFNMARLELERRKFNFLLASYHESDGKKLYRMSKIEAFIVQQLGEGWLNEAMVEIGMDPL